MNGYTFPRPCKHCAKEVNKDHNDKIRHTATGSIFCDPSNWKGGKAA